MRYFKSRNENLYKLDNSNVFIYSNIKHGFAKCGVFIPSDLLSGHDLFFEISEEDVFLELL